MKNRIHIVNWRRHGDDESECYLGVYGADDKTDANEEIERQVDPNYDWKQDDPPEDREDLGPCHLSA